MVKPEFNQVKDTKILKLDKDTKYQTHFHKGATHVWVKNGRIGFFICNDSVGDYKSTNQGHFFKYQETWHLPMSNFLSLIVN